MTTQYWMDGIPCTCGAARIDATSPLGAWGEGFFETARIHDSRILALEFHVSRMRQSLATHYERAFNEQTFERVWKVAVQAAERANHGKLKIIVSPVTAAARELRYTSTLVDWNPPTDSDYLRGVDIDFTSLPHPKLGRIGKSTAYHWARLGAYDARERRLDDVLYADADEIIETTKASIILFDGSRWSTPHETSGCLDSTTIRALDACDTKVRRASITKTDIRDAKAVALVNATTLVIGVAKLGDQTFTEPDKHVRPLRDLLLDSTHSLG